jgi:hypothetical protein
MISEVRRGRSSVRGGRHRCEDCPAIDIRSLHRWAQGRRPGASVLYRWNRGGRPLCNIDMRFHSDHVVLTDVTDPARPCAVSVSLARTACHYGGTRPWFERPSCGQRCAKLHLHRGRFLCRRCHGLGYRRQLEASAERPRLIAQRIRRSLGGSADLSLPFPAKPAPMHWRTYYRIRARGERYEARYLAGLAASMERLKRR